MWLSYMVFVNIIQVFLWVVIDYFDRKQDICLVFNEDHLCQVSSSVNQLIVFTCRPSCTSALINSWLVICRGRLLVPSLSEPVRPDSYLSCVDFNNHHQKRFSFGWRITEQILVVRTWHRPIRTPQKWGCMLPAAAFIRQCFTCSCSVMMMDDGAAVLLQQNCFYWRRFNCFRPWEKIQSNLIFLFLWDSL